MFFIVLLYCIGNEEKTNCIAFYQGTLKLTTYETLLLLIIYFLLLHFISEKFFTNNLFNFKLSYTSSQYIPLPQN